MKAGAFAIIPHAKNKGTEIELEVLPIVLCKDCKHYNKDDSDCNIRAGWFHVPPAWFCADGEKKESP